MIHPFHLRLALLGLAALGLVAGCSLSVDERVTPLDQGAIPDDLTEPTTTTTTTTVPPTTTSPEDTSVETIETTTTQPVIPIETITVYYTRGLTDVMQPVAVPSTAPTPVEELIPLLERPTGISDAGFRTSLLPGLIDDIPFIERGTATVQLDPDVLDRMSNPAQQRSIAQIVLTLTSFSTADAGNIGYVRFEVDGEGFSVYVPGFEGQSEEGEPLAFADFAELIVTSQTPPAPTTTTTVSVETSEPQSGDDGQ